MVRHGTLDSLMNSLLHLTVSNATLICLPCPWSVFA